MNRPETFEERREMDYVDPENVDPHVASNLTKLNLQYLETQLSPIVDNLVKLSTQEIYQKLDGFIEGDYNPNKLMEIAESHDKQRLFNIMAYDWIGVASFSPESNVTPWILEDIKEDTSFRQLLSTIRESLPVRVITKERNEYILDLSEGTMAGIMFGSAISDNFSFYLNDVIVAGLEAVAIRLGGFVNYLNRQSYSDGYAAKVFGEPVYFKDEDFVKGIITAAKWTNTDPHLILTDITKDGVKFTF